MKKVLSVLCVAVLLVANIAIALANPSISDLTDSVLSIEPVTPIPDGYALIVRDAQPDSYENDAVSKDISIVNGMEESIQVADLTEDLILPEGIDLADYDFLTQFSDAVLSTPDGQQVFELDGAPVSVKATFVVDVMKGVNAEDLEAYQILLIDPASAKTVLLPVEADSFVSETGEITVVFPFLGVFALVQKVAE